MSVLLVRFANPMQTKPIILVHTALWSPNPEEDDPPDDDHTGPMGEIQDMPTVETVPETHETTFLEGVEQQSTG